MRISVIIPVYNVEEYLKDCLDSVISQTYQNFEIILVDDGSTDNSGKICDEYAKKDDRIKVIHKKNEGQGVARNCALDICTGDYIAFVDSDDYIEADMFEVMLNAINQGNCDIAICGIKFHECKTGRIQNFSHTDKILSGDTDLIIQRYLTRKMFTGLCNKIYKAELFKAVRFPKLRCREDVYVLPEILDSVKRFVEIPDCKYIQNIREGSTEQKPFEIEKLQATTEAVIHQKEYIKNHYPKQYYLMELMLARTYYDFLNEVVVKNNARKKEDIYIKLFDGFREELSKVNTKVLNEEQTKEFKKYNEVLNSPKKFYTACRKKRMVFICKKMIKTLIGKLHKK